MSLQKKHRIQFMFLFVFLLSAQVVHAKVSAPQITTFSVSPDPQAPGGNVTIYIEANLANNNPMDDYVYFCLYEPDTNAPSVNPSSWAMTYYNNGMNGRPVTFNETAQGVGGEPTCPAQSGQTSILYKSDGTILPQTSRTYIGSVTWPIYSGATPGTYTWTFYSWEATDTPNPGTTSHTIAAPTAVQLQSATAINNNPQALAVSVIVLVVGTALVVRRSRSRYA